VVRYGTLASELCSSFVEEIIITRSIDNRLLCPSKSHLEEHAHISELRTFSLIDLVVFHTGDTRAMVFDELSSGDTPSEDLAFEGEEVKDVVILLARDHLFTIWNSDKPDRALMRQRDDFQVAQVLQVGEALSCSRKVDEVVAQNNGLSAQEVRAGDSIIIAQTVRVVEPETLLLRVGFTGHRVNILIL